ncbi:hypothetical protein GW17_00054701 [Ensete ventricosum]|nr:hypothetical protein GW17_00054701 [Ensete ventricosum]
MILSERLHSTHLLLFLLSFEVSLFSVPSNQVGMSSSSSSSSSPSSPQVVESYSGGPGVEVLSSSLGGMIMVDAKAYQALEAMKLCYNSDSVVTEEHLGLIQECYSIPDNIVNLKVLRGMPRTLTSAHIAQPTIEEELVKAPKVHPLDSRDARPKKKPKSTTAHEATAREAHDTKEGLDSDGSGAQSPQGKERIAPLRVDLIARKATRPRLMKDLCQT